ncbi:MAG: hypothetical protein ACETWM_20290 [Candidatus Lokiarchaeia archaeon]
MTKKGKNLNPIAKKRRDKFRARIISEGYVDYREDPNFFREEEEKGENS